MSLNPYIVFPRRDPFCVFIDVDSTLIDSASPAASPVDMLVLDVLYEMQIACDDAVALISGLPIADVDRLVEPLRFPLAGAHGAERRNARGSSFRRVLTADSIAALRKCLSSIPQALPGIEIEDRDCSVAVRYGKARHLEELVRFHVARMASIHLHAIEVIEGDSVIEVRPASSHRANAIEGFLQEAPFAGCTPILLHANPYDQELDSTIRRLGGVSKIVGKSLAAFHAFEGPEEIRQWFATELSIHQ
jgi:trehalose 6-phosphate phosphatase